MNFTLPQLNDPTLQICSIISKNKYLIVKLYSASTKNNVKVKYFPCSENRNQLKTVFILNALQNISYVYQRKKSENCFDFHIKFEKLDKFIVVGSKYIETNSMEKMLMHQETSSSSGKDLYNLFMSKLPARLLDAFLGCLDITTLIINESNLFLQPHDLVLNTISFVGIDLVVFEEDITKLEFKSIYNFLDSNIFERPQQERIDHRQKIKNFAALLLTFIMNSQIRILQNIKIPEVVSIDFAKDLLKQSPKLYEKYLKIKYVQKQIKQKAQLWKLKFLGDFLRKILVNEEDMSWGEIKQYLCSQGSIEHCLAKSIKSLANELWVRLESPIREYFSKKRIVKIHPKDTAFDTNYQLFMIVMMGQRISSLKQGCLMQEFADKRQYDLQTKKLVQQFTDIINIIIEKPVLLCQQSYEVSAKQVHERVLLEVQSRHYQSQRSLYSSNSDTSYEYAVQPQELGMECEYEENAQSLPEEVKDEEAPMTKEGMINELLTLSRVKLGHSFEARGKNVRVEHEMLLCLKAYETAFR